MVTIAERADDLTRTRKALLAGRSGWSHVMIDVARKQLEAAIDVLGCPTRISRSCRRNSRR